MCFSVILRLYLMLIFQDSVEFLMHICRENDAGLMQISRAFDADFSRFR